MGCHECTNEFRIIRLKLEEQEKRPITLANGSTHLVSYVGPIKVDWNNRVSFAGAIAMGNQVLLRVITMEDMDVMVHPATRKVIANAQNPNIPASVAMGEI